MTRGSFGSVTGILGLTEIAWLADVQSLYLEADSVSVASLHENSTIQALTSINRPLRLAIYVIVRASSSGVLGELVGKERRVWCWSRRSIKFMFVTEMTLKRRTWRT